MKVFEIYEILRNANWKMTIWLIFFDFPCFLSSFLTSSRDGFDSAAWGISSGWVCSIGQEKYPRPYKAFARNHNHHSSKILQFCVLPSKYRLIAAILMINYFCIRSSIGYIPHYIGIVLTHWVIHQSTRELLRLPQNLYLPGYIHSLQDMYSSQPCNQGVAINETCLEEKCGNQEEASKCEKW